MPELTPIRSLAQAMGVATEYVDGLRQPVVVAPETLVRVCAALGAPVTGPHDAEEALRHWLAANQGELVAPVLVAWDGFLPPVTIPAQGGVHVVLTLEDGGTAPLEVHGHEVRCTAPLPMGYHRLVVEADGRHASSTIIAAPVHAWRRPGGDRYSWGVGTQVAALRSARSRSIGDLQDLESVCRWVLSKGGDLVTALPLLPTFNTGYPEPSPYSPVSRLFWSELILDLGEAHHPVPSPGTLDVTRADTEVRAALAGMAVPDPARVDAELARYARYRGAQARLGRNWRDWPAAARAGTLTDEQVDAEEERFHLVAQSIARGQLQGLRERLERDGARLGLDLAVGVHPDGFDPWSRQHLFGEGMAVGAPPDEGFPSGQDWGFSPVLPSASRREGHRYIAASIGHQATLAGVLRVDHIMAWTRLYWIPHGFGLHQGTYVKYPAEELFAVLTLESHRHRCEMVGENLGTVPKDIFEALPRHRIWGMYLATFEAAGDTPMTGPTTADVALVGTHDTPTFAGWLAGNDFAERVHYRLLEESAVPAAQADRLRAIQRLAEQLGRPVDDPRGFFSDLVEWLGGSPSPLVIPWLEDFWLEEVRVNLPGTPSSVRPNWQRPMQKRLEEIFADPGINALVDRLHRARALATTHHPHPS
ncbi:MAG TPA: 4-alpha-glucanotransferase [Gemmatimonadales bacterium]